MMFRRRNRWFLVVPAACLLQCLRNIPLTESFVPHTTAPCRTSLQHSCVDSPCCASYPWPSVESSVDDELNAFYLYQPQHGIDATAWRGLCPTFASPQTIFRRLYSPQVPVRRSMDVSIVWSPANGDDDPRRVAGDLVTQCIDKNFGDGDGDTISALKDSIVESLLVFSDFCQGHLPTKKLRDVRFKCRLVATVGTSGAKCPQFHVDNVPVRWVQAFEGPGVEIVVGPKGVRWDAFQNDETDDEGNEVISWTPQQRNEQLVDMTEANIYRAQPGEAVLLIGSEWNQVMEKSVSLPLAVHKSPEVSRSQPRVLLTQDIMLV